MTAPTISTLRHFAWIVAAGVALLWGTIIPLLHGHGFSPLPWALAALFSLWGAVFPRSLAPLYHVWMRIGEVLGWINSRLILGIIFFGLVTPMALVMKLRGRDSLRRRFAPDLTSYRLPSAPRPLSHMEKPY
ncbi:MAG: sxtJ [Cyanobacteria bacterium RI_101]|nr:sxtJ [Cyanobacteria bacterium RI_101]